jgi:hypothetical protein
MIYKKNIENIGSSDMQLRKNIVEPHFGRWL